MAEVAALRGLRPEDQLQPAERFFEALPWEGPPQAPEPVDMPAGAFLEAL